MDCERPHYDGFERLIVMDLNVFIVTVLNVLLLWIWTPYWDGSERPYCNRNERLIVMD